MSFLVTFADGRENLCSTKDTAELMLAYWAHRKPTIRDLDQEAREREEMIGLLGRIASCNGIAIDWSPEAKALLKRLGRLP